MNSHEYLHEQIKKIDPSQPCLLLKASDITAHLVVEMWVAVQQVVTAEMQMGRTMTEAIENAREFCRIPRAVTMIDHSTEKERGALEIARAMMQWPNRRLAD